MDCMILTPIYWGCGDKGIAMSRSYQWVSARLRCQPTPIGRVSPFGTMVSSHSSDRAESAFSRRGARRPQRVRIGRMWRPQQIRSSRSKRAMRESDLFTASPPPGFGLPHAGVYAEPLAEPSTESGAVRHYLSRNAVRVRAHGVQDRLRTGDRHSVRGQSPTGRLSRRSWPR